MRKGSSIAAIAVTVGVGIGVYSLLDKKDDSGGGSQSSKSDGDNNGGGRNSDVASSNYPTNLAQLKLAFGNKEALNCTMKDGGNESVLATTKSWEKVRMSGADETGSAFNAIYLDGYMYTWSSEGNFKIKMDFSKIADDAIKDYDKETDEKIELSCGDPAEANFDLPSGVEFIDLEAPQTQ